MNRSVKNVSRILENAIIGAFLFAVVVLHSFAVDVEEPRTALLIANGEYLSFGRLTNPVPEAKQLGDALRRLGFDVTVVENAGKEEMLDALYDFEETIQSQGGGIAFFHYGGHAVQVDRRNYVIPVDAVIPDERRVTTRGIDLSEVMMTLEAGGSDTSIVILDACRDNPLPSFSRSAARGLATVGRKPPNSIIVYSAESGTVARDGVFTPTLIRYLAMQGLSFSEIIRLTRRDVYEQTDGTQTPGSYDQLFESIYLSGREISTSPPAIGDQQGGAVVSTLRDGTLYVDDIRRGYLTEGTRTALPGTEENSERRVTMYYEGGHFETRRISIDSTPELVVFGAAGSSQPFPIHFFHQPEGLESPQLFSMVPDGSGRRQITDDDSDKTDLLMSVFGNTIMYKNGWTQNLNFVRPDSQRTLSEATYSYSIDDISPDGRFVVYVEDRSCVLYDIETDTYRRFAPDPGRYLSPRVSHDGETIFVHRQPYGGGELPTIVRIDTADGTTSDELEGVPFDRLISFDVSSTHLFVAAIRNDTHWIFSYRRRDGHVETYSDGEMESSWETPLRLSPTGTELALVAEMDEGWKSQLVLIDISSGTYRSVTSDEYEPYDFRWRPDGRTIVFDRRFRRGLGIVDTLTGGITDLGSGYLRKQVGM